MGRQIDTIVVIHAQLTCAKVGDVTLARGDARLVTLRTAVAAAAAIKEEGWSVRQTRLVG